MLKTAPATCGSPGSPRPACPPARCFVFPTRSGWPQAQTGDLLNEFPTLPDRTGNAGAPVGSDGKGGEARLRVLRSGFRYSGTRPEIDCPLLLLGQHTDYGIWAS